MWTLPNLSFAEYAFSASLFSEQQSRVAAIGSLFHSKINDLCTFGIFVCPCVDKISRRKATELTHKYNSFPAVNFFEN